MTESVWGPVHQDMTALLADHPDDVPAVVDQLTEMQDVLDRVPPLLGGNPIADFNRVYLRVTTSVLERLYAGRFQDPAFVARLDVEFAGRYFDALREWGDKSTACPRVWAVLFGRIAGPEHRALPCAVVGVHAHLNFDLPFALVTTSDHLGCDLVDDGDQHHDYLQINEIFTAAVPELRQYTCNIAWRNAQKLWAVRHDLPATAKERSRLDGNAAAVGRLLLAPMGSSLQ